MTYICPFSVRKNGIAFIMCKKQLDKGIPAGTKAICGFQYQCPMTMRMENTEGAKKCKLNK